MYTSLFNVLFFNFLSNPDHSIQFDIVVLVMLSSSLVPPPQHGSPSSFRNSFSIFVCSKWFVSSTVFRRITFFSATFCVPTPCRSLVTQTSCMYRSLHWVLLECLILLFKPKIRNLFFSFLQRFILSLI